ncbi:unnamed protein product [Schistosoma margrebowiei]|uniref:Uncharacterized protein n=1 Tax=Schistosoma margrebowiei TaxID=48269 RepID=A0A183N9D7_9TREM|nr:unnamed protein product [Schistosoma margrebowiei]
MLLYSSYEEENAPYSQAVALMLSIEARNALIEEAQNQLEDLDFSDDLAIPSNTNEQIPMRTTRLAAAYESVGLSTHKRKSKILKHNTDNINLVTFDREALEDVESSAYLRCIIDEQGGSDADVMPGIGKARTSFLKLKNIWNAKQLSTNIKVIIFNTDAKTLQLYGAET